jgi:hypothetical protein
MDEKPPSFTITDRRKFTTDGDLRAESSTEPTREESPAEKPVENGARVITMPSPRQEEPKPVEPAEEAAPEEPLAGPSAEESAEQHAAYEQST